MNIPPDREVALFNAALQRPVGERAAYLERECGGDNVLRQKIEALLQVHDEVGTFLENPTQIVASPGGPVAGPSGTVRLDAPLIEKTGERIGPYKLLQQIGEGGCGVVYMAEQIQPVRRKVALKVIKLGMDTKNVIARFEAERQALALMDHPNIAKVLDAGATETGRPFFVMELVKGVRITDYCDQNNLPTKDRLNLFTQVCHAIQHAHQKGIIHRDIKPSNILVTLHDGVPVPKVIDFGIAKATTDQPLTDKTLFTAFEQFIGTPAYMSPEQAEMTGLDIDTRTDVYALGVLLYELLTGRTPFDPKALLASGIEAMRRTIREQEPERPSTALSTMLEADLTQVASRRQSDSIRLVNLVRGDLDWIVMKALEKDRTRRYETANGLAMEVQRYLANEPVIARPPSQLYRLQKLVRRNKLAFAAAAAVTVTLVAGVMLTAWQAVRATREQRIAAHARDRAVQAETEAQQQKLKAQAEAHSAAVQLADSLINQGDALTTATEYPPAYARYAEAAEQLQKLGGSLARLDLSLVRLYRASPPPLWTASLPGYLDGLVTVPSRKEIILACGDGKFYALDQITGTTVRTFGNAAGVHNLSLASSSNGPVLIAAGINFVRMVDPVSGLVLRSVDDARAGEFCVSSPDGSLAASGAADGAITLWETETFKPAAGWTSQAKGHYAAFSHDGKTLATLNDVITLWDVKTGQLQRRVPAPGSSRIAFSADDRGLLCGENGGFISLLSVDGGNTARWLAYRSNMAIRSLFATPEGNRVLATSSDGEVRLFDNSFGGGWNPTLTMDMMNQGRIFDAVYLADAGPKGCTATAGLSPADQGVVISTSERGWITAWPLVAPDRFQNRLERAISISPDGLLCAGAVSDRVEVRDVATGRTLRLLPQTVNVRATAFSRDGSQLYVGGDDGTLRSFDISRGEYLWTVRAHNEQICSIDVAFDGGIVASASSDGTTRAWDVRTAALLGSVHHQGGYGTAAIFVPAAAATNAAATPGGIAAGKQRMVIAGGDGGAIYDWDIFGDTKPRHIYGPGPNRGLTLSPDHKLVAAVSAAHSATLFDPFTLEKAGFLGPIRSAMYQVCFIDPGNSLGAWALASGGRELRVFEMPTRREILTLDSTFDDRATSTSDTGTYGINTLAASGDGAVAVAKGTGRINFALPRLYRELARVPSPIRQAEVYAEWGLWTWTRELLNRERAAGHECPPLLRARADWMCGDYGAARAGFDLAVARHEAPGWYAALCASVGDTPPSIAPQPPTARPPDPFEQLPTTSPLPAGVLAAAEMPVLKTLIGKEVLVEGVVTDSAWSRSGKVMNIHFASGVEDRTGLFCCVFLKDRPKFDGAFSGDAAGAFAGARLRVRGTLARYGGFDESLKGTAQIILTEPGQVTIVEQHPSGGYLPVPLSATSVQIRDSDSARDRATVLAGQGKFAEAEPLFREALTLRRTALGKDDRTVEQLLSALAATFQAEGKLPEAENIRREELATEKKLSGDEHAFVANSLVELAAVLRAERKFAEAEKCDREALAMRRKLLGNDHVDVVTLLAQLATALLEEERFAEAEPLARECLAIREKIMADDWRTFNMRSVLGGSLLGQKKYAEAEPLLLSGCEGLVKREDKITANGKPRLTEAHRRLVQLYEVTAQPERAAEWKQKLAAIERTQSAAKATASRQ